MHGDVNSSAALLVISQPTVGGHIEFHFFNDLSIFLLASRMSLLRRNHKLVLILGTFVHILCWLVHICQQNSYVLDYHKLSK